MTYFQGFILPVPSANKDAFTKHAASLAPSLRECGAFAAVRVCFGLPSTANKLLRSWSRVETCSGGSLLRNGRAAVHDSLNSL